MSTIGHPEALREWQGEWQGKDCGWRYIDQDNEMLRLLLAFRGCNLYVLDSFIERLESEGAPAGAELRERRGHALRLFREEVVHGAKNNLELTDLAFIGHVEWILLRKAEIERAERISIPARAKKAKASKTNGENRTGKGKTAGITVDCILKLKDEWERDNPSRGWKKYASGKLGISETTIRKLLPDEEIRKIRK